MRSARCQKGKVFVAMSGGVDSSVAAYLLKREGYEVTGVHIRCFNVDGCSEQDALDARRVAEQLDIPFYTFDFEDEYIERVVQYMIRGYESGLTPNPDVMCNKEIKFGLFYDKALALGADFIATGHYVRRKIQNRESGIRSYVLAVARDDNKDQTYFLWTLRQEQLMHCLFPIGDFLKSEVRAIARKAEIPTAEKKDSQGICFLGQVTLEDFLKAYIPEKKGDVVTTDGRFIGRHRGAAYYTIGQRHGLNLGSKNRELSVKNQGVTKAHYVAAKDVRTNTIVVAEGSDNPSLFRKEVALEDVNFQVFLSGKIREDARVFSVLARIRYRQPLVRVLLTRLESEGRCLLKFEEPQQYVSAGQSAVFYTEAGELLGGGVISAAA